jgi:hypothetical protein
MTNPMITGLTARNASDVLVVAKAPLTVDWAAVAVAAATFAAADPT